MITTKGRYAIRLILDIAEQNSDRPVTLDDIAARQEISKKYLESIVKILVKGKLVKGTSGKGGGYLLTRKPKEYNVYEILLLAEGSLAPVACLEEDAEECTRCDKCKTLPMWKKYNTMIKDYFSKITIEDILKGKKF